ncbi:hypothetical protein BRC81_07905 [Halobacteriales archaeon QS_1_68_20]|nr:MAG: hypothetical protein BRC81_07905 [Halobacteriales archaeon QS_1_68_20]
MNRRKLLKRLGAASTVAIAAGTASANRQDTPYTGSGQLQVKLPDTDEVVTLDDDCICEDGCTSCYCPCDACLC